MCPAQGTEAAGCAVQVVPLQRKAVNTGGVGAYVWWQEGGGEVH